MKAMILAAGVGSRLGALTTNTPKCLMDINGTPMLRLVADSLARAGVKSVVINLHHHAEQVQAYATNALSDLFNTVEFSHEPELLGTGGGLRKVEPFFNDQGDFFLVNADIFCSLQLSNLAKPLQQSKDILGCLAVMDRVESSYLEFSSEGNLCGWLNAIKSVSLTENPNSVRKLAFCGLQALSGRIFDYLKLEPKKSFSIIDTYMLAVKQGEKLLASEIDNEIWFDIGTPEQLLKLREHHQRLSQTRS